METCDAIIVGGGPAGSACAWSLRAAALEPIVADSATFPRDKVCAGWITPQVVEDLHLDLDDYGKGRTLQAISGFRVGMIGDAAVCEATYTRPVSFAIRRTEFDHYLLARSGAHLRLGQPVRQLRRRDGTWIVNDTYSAPVLVGAGGHWCPVARLLNGNDRSAALVTAQEAEFALGGAEASACRVVPGVVELYFERDLSGYGWCVRKGDYLNVGFGHESHEALTRATMNFVEFLRATRRIATDTRWRWRGHAYLTARRRRIVDDGVLLVGDAAGLAYGRSGEGIRPAIESGLLAASTITGAAGRYTRENLNAYGRAIHERYSDGGFPAALSHLVPAAFAQALAARLLRSQWFVRNVLLDRWFMHTEQQPLATPLAAGA